MLSIVVLHQCSSYSGLRPNVGKTKMATIAHSETNQKAAVPAAKKNKDNAETPFLKPGTHGMTGRAPSGISLSLKISSWTLAPHLHP
jgi:hypothetical protein